VTARFLLTKSTGFDAAHHLNQGDADHPYRRLHGHSFKLSVSIAGEPDPQDRWVADFAALGAAIEHVRARLDHSFLNEIPGLETPTLENLCVWVARELKDLPGLARVSVARPSLGEECILDLA